MRQLAKKDKSHEPLVESDGSGIIEQLLGKWNNDGKIVPF
jgi:hypothetical protein